MADIRLLPAGDHAVLLEAPDEKVTRALFAALQQAQISGVLALRPAARTIYLSYDPLQLTHVSLRAALQSLQPATANAAAGRLITIPLRYDGPDLVDVADIMGVDVATLITGHQAATFTVAFTGFAPGFGYMTCDDPAFDVPRRSAPRAKIKAGAVALGGRYGAVYPSDSPGGWQIIGHTDLVMWDTDRARPALLHAGDRVRFVASTTVHTHTRARKRAFYGTPALEVTQTLHPVTLQDRGRPGREGEGISPSGAMDREAAARANAILGNAPVAAVIEITGPVQITAKQAETLAFTGADMAISLHTAAGGSHQIPQERAFALDRGDSLTIAAPTRGVYGYLARRGGYDAPQIMGARAYDSLSGIGTPPLFSADHVFAADQIIGAVDPDPLPVPPPPRAGDIVTLPLLPGPRMDWFTADAITQLITTTWTVTPAISRVGLRLSGLVTLTRKQSGELASEAVGPGSIQVPHDGNPLIFMRDAPVTGGYPVIGIVPEDALSRLAQCPTGTKLRFVLQTPFAPDTLSLLTDMP